MELPCIRQAARSDRAEHLVALAQTEQLLTLDTGRSKELLGKYIKNIKIDMKGSKPP